MNNIKRIFSPLILPTIFIALAAIIISKWSGVLVIIHESQEFWAFLVIIPWLPYAFLTGGFIMGWRYNNAGLVCSTLTLALAYYGLAHVNSAALSPATGARTGMIGTIMVLLPLNLGFQSILTKRRVLSPGGIAAAVMIIVQMAFVFLLHHNTTRQVFNQGQAAEWVTSKFGASLIALSHLLSNDFIFGGQSLPTACLAAFGLSILFSLFRYVRTGDIRTAGTFCGLIAILLAFFAINPVPALSVYFCICGLILITTTFEASFSMAYLDELTGLPGRRSLNETLLNMGRKYAIAMMDVDHFKQFNDVYGHKVGDQVLRTIASRLANITGGAKTFRYGGEEFTAIFPGKGVREAAPHVEKFRQSLEATPFVVRKQRTASAGGGNKGYEQVHVTVSIGLASPNVNLAVPEKVLKAADKMLSTAKQAGRNRCCVLLPKKAAVAKKPTAPSRQGPTSTQS